MLNGGGRDLSEVGKRQTGKQLEEVGNGWMMVEVVDEQQED